MLDRDKGTYGPASDDAIGLAIVVEVGCVGDAVAGVARARWENPSMGGCFGAEMPRTARGC
jgi:hypothetical protein